MRQSPIRWRSIVRDPWLIAALSAVLVLKLTLVAIFEPGRQPDTGGYVYFAQQMLSGMSWTSDVPLAEQPMPITVFRAIGYPAVLALAMVVMPESWPWLVVALQIVLSTAALVFCFALAQAFGAGRVLAALAVFAAGTSKSLPVDVCLLTDSLAASCLIIALALLTVGAAARRGLRWIEALGIGLLLAAAMLMREGTAVLSALFVLPLAARLASVPAAARWRSAAAAILVFAPLIATSQAYQAWNESRTGYRFLTTGGQTAYLLALVYAARHDPAIFAGPDLLDRIARETVVEHWYGEVPPIVARLHKDGMTAPEMAALMQRRYFSAWRDHPAAMTRVVLTQLRENKLIPTVRPLGSVREAVFWVTGERPWPAYPELKRRALRDHDPAAIGLFIPELIETVTTLIVDLTFLVAPIWLLVRWRSARISRSTALSAMSLWLVSVGFFAAHLMIGYEHRYMAPVLPFMLALAAAGIQGVLDCARLTSRP